MNIKGVLFVEVYVGMAKMVSWWHQMALGFTLNGVKEKKGQHGHEITYWLQNGEANILITSALEPAAHDVVSFVDRHGNSIKSFGIEDRPNTDLSERFEIGLNLQDYKKFIELDISFPLRNSAALLLELKVLLNKHKLESAFFGHAGDGNWHIHVFHDDSISIKDEVINEFDVILSKYDGHISGEHGIGEVHKNRFIKMKDKSQQNLYKSIKSHLDPNFQLPSLY